MVNILIFVSHKKTGKVFAFELEGAQDNACVCACVCVYVCVKKKERMYMSMPSCVILVFSHRERPKPSYKPWSWLFQPVAWGHKIMV